MDDRDQPAVPSPRPVMADEDQLKLLAIFHYIVAGTITLFASFFIIHIAIGVIALVSPTLLQGEQHKGNPFPAFAAIMFVVMGSMAVLTGWSIAGMVIYSARSIQKHRRRMFSLIVAGILCMWVPFGTVLGVFTFVVLFRPSVRALYGEA